MRSGAQRTCALALALGLAAPVAAQTGAPRVVSLDAEGRQGTAAAASAAISATGRHVAFTSSDPLAGVATGGVRQLYVRDVQEGTTALASVGAAGPANQAVDPEVAISGDGRYVVFATTATNLDAEADGAQRDVYRKDLATGALELVSRAPNGAAADQAVGGLADISYDGSRVAYLSGAATNLWLGDASSATDVVVRDLRGHTTRAASLTNTGAAFAGVTGRPSLSGDGRRVAFVHTGTVAVRDLDTSTTADVAVGSSPDLSGSGGRVVYSTATGIATAVPGAAPRALAAGTAPSLTADGTRVVFLDTGRVRAQPTVGTAAADLIAPVRPATAAMVAANGAAVAFDLNDGPAPSTSPAAGDTDLAQDALLLPLTATDLAPPDLVAAAREPVGTAPTVVIAGSVGDPSGVASVTVGGHDAVIAADGSFAVTLARPVGATTVTLVAADCAGNATRVDVSVTREVAAAPLPVLVAPPLSVKPTLVVRRGRVFADYRLATPINAVRVRLWQRRGSGYRLVASVSGPLAPGRHRVRLSKRGLRRGIYKVQVTAISASWGYQTLTRRVSVR